MSGGESKASEPLEQVVKPELNQVYRQIRRMAGIYLDQFVHEILPRADPESLEECFEQYLWVYKLLLLPAPVLAELLSQFGERQAKANFRKLCILVHPDKNQHPLASKAFQKLVDVYQKANS